MNAWWRRIAAVVGWVMTAWLVGCGGGPATVAPSISTQPSGSTLTVGDAASFSVVVTGSAPLTYQWQRDAANIDGATASSYTLPSVAEADSGAQFRVVVQNAAGSVTSSPALLTVNAAAAPSIVSQPVGTAVAVGATASFRVVADGTGPLGYQWQRDGADISGATAASYALASLAESDSGASFRVVVSNRAGSVTSASASLTVTTDPIVPPTILTQPQSLTVVDGAPATFSVAATGTAPFSYQWRKNGADIFGGTDSILTTPLLTLADTGAVYSVVVSNGVGSATSANATVTVNYLPLAWLVQPQAMSVTRGQTAVFVASAFGSQPVTYQWKRNGVDIAGAMSSVYTTPVTTTADNGAEYSVVATNPANSITSAAARLTVVDAAVAPSIAAAPASVTVSAGQVASFAVTAAGTAPLTYQWRRNGVDIAGAASASFTTASTTIADDAARFSVRVTNSAGSVTSTDAVLTVQAAAAGQAWTAGQLLETDDNPVQDRVSGIDDAGRVMVVFRKSNGVRDVIYATRGTPNATGSGPTWSPPLAIDLLAGASVSTMGNVTDYNLQVAPGGNALAYWYHNAPCTAATYSTTGPCRYYYMARFSAASATWSAPELIGDMPHPAFNAVINDRGDVALFGVGWVRSGTIRYVDALTLFWRSAAQATLSRQLVNAVPLGARMLDMDAAGNLLLAAEAQQNATTDLVAYRGTIDSGLGAQQVLDTRGAAATLLSARLGRNGQQVVVWRQNNGTATAVWAAAGASATASLVVQELGALPVFGETILTVADSGDALLVNRYYRWRQGWVGGTWAVLSEFPLDSPTSAALECAHARNGNYLCTENGTGRWANYDASRNVTVQAFLASKPSSGYVLGVDTINRGIGYAAPLLSVGGIGATTMLNKYDVLPSPAAVAGDSRTVTNLWGAFLK
jgi:Immunoglobulin I-set domain